MNKDKIKDEIIRCICKYSYAIDYTTIEMIADDVYEYCFKNAITGEDRVKIGRIRKGEEGRRARRVLKITQRQVARECRCSLNKVYRYETGALQNCAQLDEFYAGLRDKLVKLGMSYEK